MDNDKKKVIIGVGILAGAGLAYLLTRKAGGGGGQPEGIELSNLFITPTTVAPGEPVTISVLVTNNTNETLGFVVNLTGDFIDSSGGFLDAGQSKTAVFTVTPTMEKTYNVKVDGLSGSFLCTSLPHGDIVLSNLIITPNPCTEGDTVTISVTATNQGTTNQSIMVTLRLVGDKYNDSSQQVHQIVLSPGASQVVTFTFRPTVDETYQVTVDGLSGSLVVNPGPGWPGWSEDTMVLELSAEPSTAFIGEMVRFRAYIMGPWPADYEQGVTIEGTVNVDGTTLSQTFLTHIRNPTLSFPYTPTQPGSFIATAQDKTAILTVVANPAASYYSPFGGVRIPIITDILIGDVKYSDLPYHSYFRPPFFPVDPHSPPELLAQLQNAIPLAWTPAGASINTWATPALSQYEGYGPDYVAVKMMPLDYQCQPYWNSKLELMEMIASGGMSVPAEWIVAYGTTCPTCHGTGGPVVCPVCGGTGHGTWRGMCRTCQGTGTLQICPTCKGLGKLLNVDIGRGIKDQQVPIAFKSAYYNEVYHYEMFCPYCLDYIATGSATHQENSTAIREKSTRYLINHIETSHPTHLLTEPAWF